MTTNVMNVDAYSQSSEAPAADESTRSTTSAAESAKSFIAGGFGGVCAVLVGMYSKSLCCLS